MNQDVYFDDLLYVEGCATWLYCDTRGLVTTGIGNLVATSEACVALPFRHRDGTAASADEKATAWSQIKAAFNPKKSAAYYRDLSDLRLTQIFVKDLVGVRLEREFLPGLVELCPAFESFPLPARRALVDMSYNLGLGGLAKFTRLLEACNSWHWPTAAKESHVATSSERRNTFRAQMFLDAEAAMPTC